MAKIHWSVYILVGLFVSIMSYKLNYEKLVFFYYLGYIFMFVGIIKLIFVLIKRKNKPQEAHHKTAVHPKSQAHHYKRCHKCGNVMRFNDRFCSRCGTKV